MELKADTYDRVLGDINTIRKQLGLRPVKRIRKGISGSPTNCPIAMSLQEGKKTAGWSICVGGTSVEVTQRTWRGYLQDQEILLTKVLKDFVLLVDGRHDGNVTRA